MREITKEEIKNILWGYHTKLILLGIFLAELLSFNSFYFSELRVFIFPVLALIFLIICIYKLEWGVYLVLIELFIGSLGSLFFYQIGDTNLSIRLMLWFILLLVWFIKTLKQKEKPKIFSSPYFYPLLFLSVLIVWGFVNGLLNNHSFSDLFLDFNGWLYFALIFPIYEVALKRENSFKNFFRLLITSSLWLSLKTLVLLFIFSHNLRGAMTLLYKWVRDTGVGEITQMPDTFTRIFFQSHIFVLLSFFLILFFCNLIWEKNSFFSKTNMLILFYATIFCSVVFLSFSRSFWLGGVAGIILFLLVIYWKYAYKKAIVNIGLLLFVGCLSLILITGVVKIPLVGMQAQFSTTDTLKNRARNTTGEAAVSSRWNLLPKLWSEVKENMLAGKGFGATITYTSNDPRVLENNPQGQYTTHAFEWGWLDIWFKLGLLGLVSYLIILLKIILDSLLKKMPRQSSLNAFLLVGLIVVSIINFFTPYLNHPLGIGYLIFSLALIDKLN